jgi:hypothetical protein
MGDIPNEDKAGLVAEKPENCFACIGSSSRARHPISQSSSKCCARTAPFPRAQFG